MNNNMVDPMLSEQERTMLMLRGKLDLEDYIGEYSKFLESEKFWGFVIDNGFAKILEVRDMGEDYPDTVRDEMRSYRVSWEPQLELRTQGRIANAHTTCYATINVWRGNSIALKKLGKLRSAVTTGVYEI